jgi:hypothetical protein
VGVLPESGARALGPSGAPGELDRHAELAHRPGSGLLDLHHHVARADELRRERLVELEDRLEAAVVLRSERPPLLARSLEEDPLHLGVGARTGRVELALDQVLAAHPAAELLPELGLERAEGHVPVAAGVRPVADDPARQLEPPAPRRLAVAEVASHDHRQPGQRPV